MSADAIEAEIQAKGLTAPRVTPADIEAAIASEHYFTAADGVLGAQADHEPLDAPLPLSLLTFCVLVMRNGFTVVGKSACASPENFDADLGRKIARQDAINQCWPLLGYELRSKLANEKPPKPVFTPYSHLDIKHWEMLHDPLGMSVAYCARMGDGALFKGTVPYESHYHGLALADINRQAEAEFNRSSGKIAT